MEISTSYVVYCLCALLYNYLVNAQAAHLPTHHVKLCRKLHKCTHLSEKHSRHQDFSNYTRLRKTNTRTSYQPARNVLTNFFGDRFRRPRCAHELAEVTLSLRGEPGRANILAMVQTGSKLQGTT